MFHGGQQGDACLDEFAVPLEPEQERMLRDLEGFRDLGKDKILGILRVHGWDVEKSILPLFQLVEAQRASQFLIFPLDLKLFKVEIYIFKG